MRVFLSYKFTGVPLDELYYLINHIRDAFVSLGHELYCNLYDNDMYINKKMSPKEILEHALAELSKSDIICVLNNGAIGEGMGIEFGYAHSNNMPIILLLKKGVKSVSFAAFSNLVIEFDTMIDMCESIKLLDLGKICYLLHEK